MTQVASQTVRIANKRGLHARASAKFCKIADAFEAEISVAKDGQEVEGCSIMELLMLGAGMGSEIEIKATGAQAEEAVDVLVKLVEEQFGEGE